MTFEAGLVDVRSGNLLWEGSASASSAEQGGASQGGLLGLLLKAVVYQIISASVGSRHPLAGTASQRLLAAGRQNGVPYGPRSPNHGKP